MGFLPPGFRRMRLRGPNGARDEFHLAATVQSLRKLAMLIPVPARPHAARGLSVAGAGSALTVTF